MKNRLTFIVCLLVLLSTPVYAQSGFYELPISKKAIGIGYQRYRPPKRTDAPFRFHAQTILGSLDYAFSRDLKVSLLPGVSFFDVNTQNPTEIAPSPSIDIRLLNINELNMTGLKFFISGGFRTQYMNIVRTGNLPLHSVNMALRGGAGFLHFLETDHGWKLKPFFALFATQVWDNVSSSKRVYVNTSRNFFTGEAGIEVELSPTMSTIGSIEFPFDSSELLYRFGVNFHQAPDLNILRETTPQNGSTETDTPEVIAESGQIDYEPNLEIAGPQYKSKVDPKYPELAIAAGQIGVVILETIINEDGIPIDIVKQTDLGYGLEAAAIAALKQTRFHPAIYRGLPIPMRVTIRYIFRIQDTIR